MSVNEFQRMGRRRFTKSLLGLGVSPIATASLTGDDLANLTNDLGEEVPRLKGWRRTNLKEIKEEHAPPKYEPVHYTIPRDRWEYIEGVHSAAKKLRKKFSENDLVKVSVHRAPGHRPTDDLSIQVSYEIRESHRSYPLRSPEISFTRVKDMLPDKISGAAPVDDAPAVEDIDVVPRKVRVSYDDYFTSCYHCDSDDEIPGGAAASSSGAWTIGVDSWDSADSEWVWVTAGHCVDHQTNVAVEQGSSTTVGYSKEVTSVNEDAATISPVSGKYTESDLAENNSQDSVGWPIEGTYSHETLKDKQAAGDSLYLQGRSSGRPAGTILDVRSEDIIIDVDSTGGDSGGPYFGLEGSSNYKVWVAAIHSGSQDWDDDGYGEAAGGYKMEWIEDYFNLGPRSL